MILRNSGWKRIASSDAHCVDKIKMGDYTPIVKIIYQKQYKYIVFDIPNVYCSG